jgi:hypothetical protein
MPNAVSSALLIRRDRYSARDLLDHPRLLIVDFQFPKALGMMLACGR